MGMSNSQKARKYGVGSAPGDASGSTSVRPSTRPVRVRDIQRAELAPRPTDSSSPALVVGAVLGIGTALWLYYHFLVLPGFSRTMAMGLPTPEMMVGGFDTGYAQRFAGALDGEGHTAYRGAHSGVGVFAPLLLALGWLTFSGANTPQRGRKWLYWVIGLAYAVIFLVGNRVLENAVSAPGDPGLVGLASGLVIARWALLGILLIAAILISVSVFRRKLDDFAEGKLPGQRPRG